jgi:hypothetical protein
MIMITVLLAMATTLTTAAITATTMIPPWGRGTPLTRTMAMFIPMLTRTP